MTDQVEVAEEPVQISSSMDPQLVGIRGWLILPAIGLVYVPIVSVAIQIAPFVMFSDRISDFDSTALVFELAVGIGMTLFSIYAAIRFFKKKRNAPSVIVTLILVSIGASILEYVVLTEIQWVGSGYWTTRIFEHLVRKVGIAIVWIPYFRVSKRVKVTFVN